MSVAIVSRHLPSPEGSAAGRVLLATVEGLLAEGHDVRVVSWSPAAPDRVLPGWCTWRPIPRRSRVREHLAALTRPRGRSAGLEWEVSDHRIAIADDPPSFAAVEDHPSPVGTVHYATAIDARALGRYRPRDLQDVRAEVRLVRRASCTLTYSSRVADAVRWTGASGAVRPVPAAISLPDRTLPLVESPIAALVADWSWNANVAAAGLLVRSWPRVRTAVPGARLVLAGRGNLSVGTVTGVEFLGPVSRTEDVLAETAVVAFPCPATSGPKVKVLEAFAAGVAVVTTPAGVEGIVGGADVAAVADLGRHVDALIAMLRDPGRRARLVTAARATVEHHHGPRPSARARMAALGTLDR